MFMENISDYTHNSKTIFSISKNKKLIYMEEAKVKEILYILMMSQKHY